MIRAYEITDKEKLDSVLKEFRYEENIPGRSFAAEKDGKALAFVRLVYDRGIKIEKIAAKDGADFLMFDLAVRTALNAVRDMTGQTVYIDDGDDYFLELGFVRSHGTRYEVKAENIDFCKACRKEKQKEEIQKNKS